MGDRPDSFPMFPAWLWAGLIIVLALTVIALGVVADSMRQPLNRQRTAPITVVVGPSAAVVE